MKSALFAASLLLPAVVQASDYEVVKITSASGSHTIHNRKSYCLLAPLLVPVPSYIVEMPASPKDGQVETIATSGEIERFTVMPNIGQSLSNTPATLLPSKSVKFLWVAPLNTWYRIF